MKILVNYQRPASIKISEKFWKEPNEDWAGNESDKFSMPNERK
jgi:hypothetical protein